MRSGRISSVLVVHATRALRDRMPTAPATSDDVSATALGAWYATRLPWRRPAVLLVNHTTLLPLLMPLAPAATLLARVPDAITELLHHHLAAADLIATEQTAMTEVRVAPTTDRSTVGVLNEFARLADWPRSSRATTCSTYPSGWQPPRWARSTAATSARTANSPP